ncbi:MAG: metal ABC transporter substrate-binding protein [Leptospiraceae bacterium]|nr:metal ABC transporter substrate-binding protein [Leptospiraceae bacterium]
MNKTVPLLVLFFTAAEAVAKPLQVITTTTDLASIAQEVGRELVSVESLTKGNTDLHFVMAQPNFILKLNEADIFIEIGLDLEASWTPYLLAQSRNPNIQRGRKGYCVAVRGIKLLNVPVGEVSRFLGDMHVYGNPHYWADPVNGIIIARNIRDTFIANDPTNAESYRRNFDDFAARTKKLTAELLEIMKPHRGKRVYVYHQEFNYLANRFGFEIAGAIEEKMGVTPGPGWIRTTIETIKKEKIKIILCSPWTNVGVARRVAEESGARLLVLPIQTGAGENTETWLKMIETNVKAIAQAFAETEK